MSDWRMTKPCDNCPFNDSGAGLHLRKSLNRSRWAEIKRGLLRGEHFMCHKTTNETGDGSNRVCAGSITFQDKHGTSSQYVRICERMDYFKQQKASV